MSTITAVSATIKLLKTNPPGACKFHYGKYVDTADPIAGVGNDTDVGEIADSMWNHGIDPDLEQYCEEHPDEEIDDWECHTRFYGYKKAADGKYDYDTDVEYSAIWNDWAGGTYTITRSPYVQFSALCSPCCPGQASLGTSGQYPCYSPSIECLDPWVTNSDVPKVWVWDIDHEIKNVTNKIHAVANRIIFKKSSNPTQDALYNHYLKKYLNTLEDAREFNELSKVSRMVVSQVRLDA